MKKPLFFGILGSVLLLGLYFIIVSLANSFQHALQEFQRMWYWMLLLVIGFGVQIGLMSYIREVMKAKKSFTSTKKVVATGSISTASMISCCAHHITDIIPILGVSAVSLFFTKYQVWFLIIGILSNILGVYWMLMTMQRHQLYEKKGILHAIMKFDLQRWWKYTLSMSIFIAVITILLI